MSANLKQLQADLHELEMHLPSLASRATEETLKHLILNMKGTIVLLDNELTAPPFLAPGDNLRDNALTLVIAEMDRQDRKWGSQRKQPSGTWLKILVEEVGEVAEAMLDEDNAAGARQEEDFVREETVQVAAVAVQYVIARLQSKLDAQKLRGLST